MTLTWSLTYFLKTLTLTDIFDPDWIGISCVTLCILAIVIWQLTLTFLLTGTLQTLKILTITDKAFFLYVCSFLGTCFTLPNFMRWPLPCSLSFFLKTLLISFKKPLKSGDEQFFEIACNMSVLPTLMTNNSILGWKRNSELYRKLSGLLKKLEELNILRNIITASSLTRLDPAWSLLTLSGTSKTNNLTRTRDS